MRSRGGFLAALLSALAGCASPEAPPRQITPWTLPFAGQGDQTLRSLAVGPAGQVAFTGGFYIEHGLGSQLFHSAGDEDAFLGEIDDAGRRIFDAAFGSASDQEGQSVAFAPDGDLLVAGNFAGQIDLGRGVLDTFGPVGVYVARFDASGHARWSRAFFNDSGYIDVSSAAVDAEGNLLLGGSFMGSADFGGGQLTAKTETSYVAKLGPGGEHLYSFRFSGGSHLVNAIAVDPTGAVLVGGAVAGAIGIDDNPPPVPAPSFYVARLERDGQPSFLRRFGGQSPQDRAGIKSLATDATGAIVLNGKFGGHLGLGDVTITSRDYTDAFVAKLSPRGDPLWLHQYGPAPAAGPIAVDASGRIFLAGVYTTALDFGGKGPGFTADPRLYVAEFDAAGELIDVQSYGQDSTPVTGDALALDPAGGLVLGGTTQGLLAIGGTEIPGSFDAAVTFLAHLRIPLDPAP